MMKKKIATLYAAAVLTCFTVFPSMAAETRAEYKQEASPIRNELQAMEEEMKPLRQENKDISAKYKSIRLEKKNTQTLSVSRENWKKAKELRGKISEIHKKQGETTVSSLRKEAAAAAKEKDFNGALEKLYQASELKKSRLEDLKEMNEIWHQIDALLK